MGEVWGSEPGFCWSSDSGLCPGIYRHYESPHARPGGHHRRRPGRPAPRTAPAPSPHRAVIPRPAATATAPSAAPRSAGSLHGVPNYCPCRTITWSSRCRTSCTLSPKATALVELAARGTRGKDIDLDVYSVCRWLLEYEAKTDAPTYGADHPDEADSLSARTWVRHAGGHPCALDSTLKELLRRREGERLRFRRRQRRRRMLPGDKVRHRGAGVACRLAAR